MPPDAPAAFFSYSRDDSEFALRLAGDLRQAGAHVWMDQLDIQPGQRWARAVQDALTNSPRLLVILSPSSVSSTNVDDEVAFALDEHKTVIPVFYRDCSIPFRLRPLQYADFRVDYARGLKVLLTTLGVDKPVEPAAFSPAPPSKPFPEEQKAALEGAKLEDERKQAAEQARLEEERKQAAEQARLEEERKQAAEQARLEEERKQAAEQARLEEERKQAAEQARLEEERKQAARARQAKERKQAAEQRRLEKEKTKASELGRRLEQESPQSALEKLPQQEQEVETQKPEVGDTPSFSSVSVSRPGLAIAAAVVVLAVVFIVMYQIAYWVEGWGGSSQKQALKTEAPVDLSTSREKALSPLAMAANANPSGSLAKETTLSTGIGTRFTDPSSKGALLGEHRLSCQCVSWQRFGKAVVSENSGVLTLKGSQNVGEDYVTVDGVITSVEPKSFAFRGTIITRYSHGQPCERNGNMTFRITGSRQYWRLQQMDNPCNGYTDYVDIYFR